MRSEMGYHLLLRFYPRSYRRERGREMVDTFLEAGHTWPSLREALNLFAQGMRCRLGARRSAAVRAGCATAVLALVFAASPDAPDRNAAVNARHGRGMGFMLAA
jgi:hypothetical protein